VQRPYLRRTNLTGGGDILYGNILWWKGGLLKPKAGTGPTQNGCTQEEGEGRTNEA